MERETVIIAVTKLLNQYRTGMETASREAGGDVVQTLRWAAFKEMYHNKISALVELARELGILEDVEKALPHE